MRDRGELVDVAMGRQEPDVVIKDVNLVNVLSREIHPADILIAGDRIAAVLPAGEGGEGRESTIDGREKFAAPGFIDPHVHIESSMLTVREYSRMVIPRGTTMIAADPHEMGNVLGIPGMRALFDEAASSPLRTHFRVPGRIPAMPEWIETSNGSVSVDETGELFNWPEAVCLAGDINPRLILEKDDEQFQKFDLAERLGRMISGQSPGLRGRELAAFLAAGPEDSHVARTVEEIIENTRLGMASVLALRPGRVLDSSHLAELARIVKEQGLDTRQFQLCTDDIHAHDLLHEGHIDHRLRTAIEAGFGVVEAYQFATINVAQGLRIAHDYGSISPGRVADILLLSDLESVSVETTIIGGKVIYADSQYEGPTEQAVYPDWTKSTIKYQKPLKAEDFHSHPINNTDMAKVLVVGHAKGKGKVAREEELSVQDGVVQPDGDRRINALAMVERHGKNGGIGVGFSDTAGLTHGALACSVNHDAHNIAIFGANHEDMAIAANRMQEIGGGYVLVRDGKVAAELALPVAGLMSENKAEDVAQAMQSIREVYRAELGGHADDMALIYMNFLALPNIPAFGFTDKGLIASDKMQPVDSVIG
ncbi:adenine deaminase C-terminal domain-containing protein [Shimia sp.]|uniref:adenine deaminase n=1 Tax=Shimia sp. TaxID=1954381 RepID=UPI0032994DEC